MLDNDDTDNSASSAKRPSKNRRLSRRAILKAGAVATGAAIGSDVIRGFPTIWTQEIKDIELRHVGVSYSVAKAIGDQPAKDLGFEVMMQNLDTSAAINRFVGDEAVINAFTSPSRTSTFSIPSCRRVTEARRCFCSTAEKISR